MRYNELNVSILSNIIKYLIADAQLVNSIKFFTKLEETNIKLNYS